MFRPHLFLRTTYWHPCAATGPGHSISWGKCRRESRGFHCYLYRVFQKVGDFIVLEFVSNLFLEVLKLRNHHYQQQQQQVFNFILFFIIIIIISSSSSITHHSSFITKCLFLTIPHIYHPGGHLETDHLRLQFVK